MENQHEFGPWNKNPLNVGGEKDVLSNIMNISILNFKLDQNLTVIWANDDFYKNINYTKKRV
ncbi:hypothetical protein [Anaerofustis stercorihominis]|uniref:hypothetical protein n=1 Tax=Anaerofustis stercorihominis TaxID=214853 RepID=UPI0034660EF7